MADRRKKPGRPRKRIEQAQIGVHGIVTDPINSDDCVELIYNRPMLFKCIISIFKEYDCSDVIMEFSPIHVMMIGIDHTQRVVILITIESAHMNLYYYSPPSYEFGCDDERRDILEPSAADDGGKYRITIKRDNLESVAAIIERVHVKLTISLHKGDPSALHISLDNGENDSRDNFEINIVPRSTFAPPEPFIVPDLSKCKLEFTIDSRQLRKKINEMKRISDDMIIKKKGDDTGLEISLGSSSRVQYTGVWPDEKIGLRHTIAPNELFISTLQIGRVRPLIAVNLPGGITFLASDSDPLVIQVGLDMRTESGTYIADADVDEHAPAITNAHAAVSVRLLINTKRVEMR